MGTGLGLKPALCRTPESFFQALFARLKFSLHVVMSSNRDLTHTDILAYVEETEERRQGSVDASLQHVCFLNEIHSVIKLTLIQQSGYLVMSTWTFNG